MDDRQRHHGIAPIRPALNFKPMNELSIKVGGVYRTRGGRKAVIVAELRGVDKWLGIIVRDYVDAAETWAANGMYMQSGDESGFDLVAEWEDAK